MKFLSAFWLVAIARIALAETPQSTQYACKLFSKIFPSQTFYSGNSTYNEQNTDYWSAASWLGPACIFEPQDTSQMSYAIKALSQLKAPFAIRGGGHMPITGASNIDSTGVLLSTTGFTTLQLSSDKSILSVGPGNKWTDVQTFLKPDGLAAVGGRVGLVGVSGYTLGGGISFYGNQHGFTSANVVAYECVLHDGTVVTADSTSNSDLFWALKGGGNSFAVVTRFDMKVYDSPSVYAGIATYAPTEKTKFLDATYNFAAYGSRDDKAAIIPIIFPVGGTDTAVYIATRFYDSTSSDGSNAFTNFTSPSLSPLTDTYSPRHISDYLADEADPQSAIFHGTRQKFHVLSSTVSREALDIVHDALISHVNLANSTKTPILGLTADVAMQPITQKFIKESMPVPQFDYHTLARGPYFWYCLSVSWYSADQDDAVKAFIDGFSKDVNEQFEKKGLSGGYLYMNDADGGQEIFENYPKVNLERLKAIREKYDADNVFTDLMAGGWKVAHAA